MMNQVYQEKYNNVPWVSGYEKNNSPDPEINLTEADVLKEIPAEPFIKATGNWRLED